MTHVCRKSVLCRQRMDISPVTQQTKKNMCVEKHRSAIMQPCTCLDSQPGRLNCHARQISMRSWNCPLEHDGRKEHVEMYCRGKHNQLHIPNNSAPPPETKHDLREVTGKNKASTPSAFFFFCLLLGGMDIHYTRATITTSKKRDVHCKP